MFRINRVCYFGDQEKQRSIAIMRSPFAPVHLLVFIVLLALLLAFVHVGILAIAFDKLGLSENSAFLLLFASLFGSAVNIPLFSIEALPGQTQEQPLSPSGLLRQPATPFTGRTIVAVNFGGCIIPFLFSLYLIIKYPLSIFELLIGITLVSMISYFSSRPIPRLGIGMPIFVAPFTAVAIALLLEGEFSAPFAYISGTLGVIIGADLFRLNDVRKLATPFASIGGAGTFDGIFITGIVAVLLA